MRDLVVAGGGPVGLATALHAHRAGLSVVVREPRTGPIDKACGEGLMPGAVAELAALGVHPHGRELTGIRYLDGRAGGPVATARFAHGPGRGVRRTVLHEALAERVAAAGIPVEPSAVTTVADAGDHLLVDGEPARHLVAADGLHSPVRRLVGLDAPVAGRRRFGLRCHVRQAPWTSYVEVHWSPRAEAYVTPVDDDLVGVAVLGDAGSRFADLIDDFPVLQQRLVGARTRVMGAGPLRQRARARSAGRVLLVGDAGGYVDALTGEGLALGLAQARVAVACLAAGRAGRYDGLARRLGVRHELLTHALLRATAHATVRRRLVPAASRLPWLFDTAVNQLARPVGRPS
ncbi:NAD(P)/FAD-dependent oxidoreductase [Nocardioides sp. zg-1228]|uniref:NAD(P)/FAD-dependent oxidoreductase n=1 Tax=Nocardioides sp. zg-1228 TaxID=2763008 RepID=UPI00164249B2|nr:NAD(P)/FAD-dependent oxidoreductase [Nocardioides sp. zg-1228]MBC2933581.1 NAD(P)/FAD-dependent oxidoreductase [Nocardioides sp. zg-1228]QSF56292.1 NAD(P)/FAD-dependent oxidoreductase [Nocardioides sp. zg-1228]